MNGLLSKYHGGFAETWLARRRLQTDDEGVGMLQCDVRDARDVTFVLVNYLMNDTIEATTK